MIFDDLAENYHLESLWVIKMELKCLNIAEVMMYNISLSMFTGNINQGGKDRACKRMIWLGNAFNRRDG